MLKRYKVLNLVPYKGFVNPVYTPVYDASGKMTDVKVSYTEGFAQQHLRYSKEHGNLPTYN
jgi:dipeptidyl-peptidase-3